MLSVVVHQWLVNFSLFTSTICKFWFKIYNKLKLIEFDFIGGYITDGVTFHVHISHELRGKLV